MRKNVETTQTSNAYVSYSRIFEKNRITNFKSMSDTLNTEVIIESNNNHSEMCNPILNTFDIIIGTLL